MIRRNRLQLGLLSGSHLVNDFLNGVLIAILPLLQAVYGLSFSQLSGLVLASGVFAFLLQPALGYLADKRERPWLLPVSTLLLGGGLYAMAWTSSYVGLMLAVIVSALGSAAYHPDANRSVYLLSPEKRGLSQSIFQIGGNTGMALAPISLWFLNREGLQGMVWFLLGAVLMGLVLFVFARGANLQAVKKRTSPASGASATSTITSGNRAGEVVSVASSRSILVTLIAVVTSRSLATMGLNTFLPLYLIHTYAFDKGSVWMYTFWFMLGGAIGTFTGGPLGDRFGKRRIIQYSLFASLPFAVAVPILQGPALMVLLFVMGFVMLSTFAVTVVYAQDLMPGKEGMASSLMVGLTGGISGVAILGLGFLADRFGLYAILWMVLSMPFVGAALSLLLPRGKRNKKVFPKATVQG